MLHPLRWRILLLLPDDREVGEDEIAAAFAQAPGQIGYHLRVLVRGGALKALAGSPTRPIRYRWAPQARWTRKMLDAIERGDTEDGERGRN